ncbi:cytochrome c peroxidase [Castellaniella sp. S9]
MSPALAQCGSKCASRCQGRCAASATKCGAKCSAKCGAKCAAKCGAKCAAKCGAKCGVKADASLIQRPAGYKPNYSASNAAQVAAGETLFRSTRLSSNGLSCATCHTDGAGFTPGFAKPFPHLMQMASMNYGVGEIFADEAVQVCMAGPMATKPLAWDSADLQNLSAYVLSEQARFAKK